ncbi:MAG: hypothetical protein JST93_00145 [Acidobacteria bacterium]|nr:hypothetical protein [Acidobacteriota bacterium]
MQFLALAFVLTALQAAENVYQADAMANSQMDAASKLGLRSAASVRPTDLAFPHLAVGDRWETILVIVNMSARPVSFSQNFWTTTGAPLEVTFRSIPDGRLTTTSSARGTLQPGSSFNILLFDSGPPLKTGWSSIDYATTSDRLGGFAIFRQISTGGVFEALVPLSSVDDFRFFMPFDNLEGFVTSMAILNPGAAATEARLTFRNTAGTVLASRTVRLPGGNQTAFAITDTFPETRGQAGVLLVEGSSSFLSGLGFRFHPRGAFATIPIMNWAGMFP